MNVLVPVRHPLTERNVRAVERAIEAVDGAENPEVVVLYVNELHQSAPIDRADLRDSVEAELGEVHVSYVVRNGFSTDEAILDEAIRLAVDMVVISQERRTRWGRLLDRLVDGERDIDDVLETTFGIAVESVPE